MDYQRRKITIKDMIQFGHNPNKEGKASKVLLQATVYFFNNDECIINDGNKNSAFSTTNSFRPLTNYQIEAFIENCENGN